MKKILSIVLAFALFMVPVTTVRAVSLRDVMDQVTSLKTEVAQLKSVVNGKVLGATTTTVISRTLAPGLKNDPEVLKLQVWLNQKGYLAVTPDGNYGPQTTEAVKRFQAANKLTATGTVDYQTMTAINQTVANTPPVIAEPGSVDVDTFIKSIPDRITALQNILKDSEKFKADVIKNTPTIVPPASTSKYPITWLVEIQGYVNGVPQCIVYEWNGSTWVFEYELSSHYAPICPHPGQVQGYTTIG